MRRNIILSCKVAMTLLLSFSAYTSFANNYVGKTVYIFGVSQCFSDTVVYLTDIQELEGVAKNRGRNFDGECKEYSKQYKDYIVKQNGDGFVSSVFYFDTKAKAERKFVQLKRKLSRFGERKVENVSAEAFKFVVRDVEQEAHVSTPMLREESRDE